MSLSRLLALAVVTSSLALPAVAQNWRERLDYQKDYLQYQYDTAYGGYGQNYLDPTYTPRYRGRYTDPYYGYGASSYRGKYGRSYAGAQNAWGNFYDYNYNDGNSYYNPYPLGNMPYTGTGLYGYGSGFTAPRPGTPGYDMFGNSVGPNYDLTGRTAASSRVLYDPTQGETYPELNRGTAAQKYAYRLQQKNPTTARRVQSSGQVSVPRSTAGAQSNRQVYTPNRTVGTTRAPIRTVQPSRTVQPNAATGANSNMRTFAPRSPRTPLSNAGMKQLQRR